MEKKKYIKEQNTAKYHRTKMQKELILQKMRDRGCRITSQREMLLDVILEEESNPSGSDVRIMDRNGSFGNFVPTAILSDPIFASMCDLSKGWVCMIYMSSI